VYTRNVTALRRWRAWLLALLAVYAVLLAANPLLHHDVACHLKSPTHCTSCTASPWASRIEAGVPLVSQPLPDAGRVVVGGAASVRAADRLAPAGRSPPV
jgi:hypothetical protein